MSFWDKNLEVIKEKDNDMFNKIQEHENIEKNSRQFIIEQARDGSDILGISDIR